MADENVKLHDLAANATLAKERLFALGESGGQAGAGQRDYKNSLQNAKNVPASAPGMAPADSVARVADDMDKLDMSRLGGSNYGQPGKPMNFGAEAKREIASAQQNIRNIGNRTFYQRGGQWIDSQVTKTQETNAKRIKQFSDEYFELARQNGKAISQYLAFDEPVLLNLDNQAYLIEP
jgi:Ca-activated chloride channel family protein